VAAEVTWAVVALWQPSSADQPTAAAAAAAQALNSLLQETQAAVEASASAAATEEASAAGAGSQSGPAARQERSVRLVVGENKREAARSAAAFKAQRDATKRLAEIQAEAAETEADAAGAAAATPALAAPEAAADDGATLAALLLRSSALTSGALVVGVGYSFWQPLAHGSGRSSSSSYSEGKAASGAGGPQDEGVWLALMPVALVSADGGGCVAQAVLSRTTRHRAQPLARDSYPLHSGCAREATRPRAASPYTSPSAQSFSSTASGAAGSAVTAASSPGGLDGPGSLVDSGCSSRKRKRSLAQVRWASACVAVRAAVAFQRGGDKQLLASVALRQYLELACGSDASRKGATQEFAWVLSQRAAELADRGELPSRFADLADLAGSRYATRSVHDAPRAETAPVVVGGLNDVSKRGLLRLWLAQKVSGDLLPQAYAVAEGLREVRLVSHS
jgi:hypothetical protein